MQLLLLFALAAAASSPEAEFVRAEELLTRAGSSPTHWDKAEVLLRGVLRVEPRHVGALIDMGLIHGRRQQSEKSIASYREALAIDPTHPSALNNLAVLLSAAPKQRRGGGGGADEGSALELMLAAARLRPANAKICYNAAYRLINAARAEEGVAIYDRAIDALTAQGGAQAADDAALLSILRAAVAPPTYRNALEPQRWWQSAHAATDALLRQPRRALRSATPLSLGTPPFGLTYTGLPHAALMRKFALLALRAFPGLAAVSPLLAPSPPAAAAALPRARKRLTLGVVLERHRNTSPARLLLGPLSTLDRSRFELIVLPLAVGAGNRAPRDRHTQRLCDLADRVVELHATDVDSARNVISAEAFDGIIYAAVGMSQMPYLLSFARLAPVQIVFGHGHPVPPGTPGVDYWVSSDLFEPTQVSKGGAIGTTDASSQLVRFDTLSAALESPAAEMAASAVGSVTRAQLGLPPRPAPIYACLQHSLKFHPRFDAALGAALSAAPDAVLLLLNSTAPLHRRRWATPTSSLAPHLDRIVYLPVLPHAEFLALLRDVVDVSLDTAPWGGGVTTFESLAAGVPVVYLPTDTTVLQLTQGQYRQMGVAPLAARDASHFAELARAAAHNAPLRQRLRERASLLFDASPIGREWSLFVERAVLSAQGGVDIS